MQHVSLTGGQSPVFQGKSRKGADGGTLQLGNCSPCRVVNLQSALNSLTVDRGDARGGGRIDSCQLRVQRGATLACSALVQLYAQLRRALWHGRESMHQCPNVEHCSTNEQGHPPPLMNRGDAGGCIR